MQTNLFLLLTAGLLCAACSDSNADGDAMGTFEAMEITVSAETTGRIERFDVEEGDTVAAGQVVGCLDTTALDLRRRQILATRGATLSRQSDVATQVASLRRQIETQERELARYKSLVAARAAGQKTVDDIAAQIDVLRKQLAAQQQTMERSNAGLTSEARAIGEQAAQTVYDIQRSYLRAPQRGTILVKYAEAGEYAVPGKPLFKMADTHELFLRVYVTAAQYNELRLGQRVKVSVDKGDGDARSYDGRVVWIAEQAEFTPKTIQTKDERQNLVYAVKVLVKNDGFIKIGQYGSVRLTGA